jgi:hypothetical protein
MMRIEREDWRDELEPRRAYAPGEGLTGRLTPAQVRSARLIVDVKRGGRWRQSLSAPFASAAETARIAEAIRREPGVEEVALSIETRDAAGCYARRRLFQAPGCGGAVTAETPLAGFAAEQWDLFVGSWLDQADPDAEEEDAPVDLSRFPFGALIRSPEMRTATVALSIPALALLVALGLQLNLLREAVASSVAAAKPSAEVAEALAEAAPTSPRPR